MSRFYLTLPSNSSMEYYPENTVAQYTTKLNSQIELEGDWEVGLTEISFPTDVESGVVTDQFYYIVTFYDSPYIRKVTLQPGHYKRVRDIISEMHSAQIDEIYNCMPYIPELIGIGHSPIAEFSYVSRSKRMKMTFREGMRIDVMFSPALARLLGFEGGKIYSESVTVAEKPMDLFASVHLVYVYCDLLEHVSVGDTKAPLLRIVDKPRKAHGNVHRVLNPTLYVPLQKKNFDTVEINIMTDTGQPVPFMPGKSVVVLEFRRVVHPYFGI